MEERDKNLFRDFWVNSHMGVVIDTGGSLFTSGKKDHSIPSGKFHSSEREGYQAFENGGIFGNGYAFDALMFNMLF